MSDGYTLLLAGVFVTSATQGERPLTDPSTPAVQAALGRQRADQAAKARYARKGARV